MINPIALQILPAEAVDCAEVAGHIVILGEAKLKGAARALPKATREMVARAYASEAFEKLKAGEALSLNFPAGLKAEKLSLLKLPAKADAATTRKAGAWIGAALDEKACLVLAEGVRHAPDLAHGIALRAYRFEERKSTTSPAYGAVKLIVDTPEAVAAQSRDFAAVTEGVFFARDLVSEPANILTTDDFAARLAGMQELGLEVEILEEDDLKALGMEMLLAVGHGSVCPSKVVVMEWKGAGDDRAPLALVGKGVCFDTGGISLKPAAGMEAMTMDMGGAATVAGVMRALALRNARANVVGLVGLVENMPSGAAQRPGDIVRSMKGTTVEVINTDAEGRLVLGDVLWYAQERFKPSGVIDLATLTGAVIVALGSENTGVFSNNDAFCDEFMAAAKLEDEGAWRLPLGEAYSAKLKSDLADLRNVAASRDGGAVVAAAFLEHFIQPEMPWIHLDIAGTALTSKATTFAPKGATGWGVRALNRMIARREG